MIPKLEKYELLEDIGHGGMATVYRARDRRLGREVAIKIIHRHLRENPEVAQRFASEARAVAKLKHPNIVEVYDVSDEDEEERYLVVELVRGVTLRQLLAEHGHLPPEIAAAVGVEIGEALQHAHDFGVIHRDVKPENVLIVSARRESEPPADRDPVDVKITDFGIAKLLDAQGVTSTGQVLGSPAHMAPEQIEGGEVTARSDVFGMGVLLYESMVGRLPFDGRNPAQVLRRVLEGVFTSADRARPTVGAAYTRILDRALAHESLERFGSPGELAQALRDELKVQGVESARQELHTFLLDPATYREQHEARTVARLVERAGAARAARDMTLATALYNRALAYRPSDPELLASVSTLARRERLGRLIRRTGTALLGTAVIATGVVAVARLGPGQGAVRTALPPPQQASVAKPAPPKALPAQPVASTPQKQPAERRRPATPKAEPKPKVEGLARVRILVEGPQNAVVRVDGTVTPWFGKIHEMPAGRHTFEFTPPDEVCCEDGPTLTLEVPVSGGPDDTFTVRGRIPFRPATLDFRGDPGESASCGALGVFHVPGQTQIDMTAALQTVHCQLLPAPGSGDPPKEFDVTLRPGRLSTNLGQ